MRKQENVISSLNPISADSGQKCPIPYDFLYIFQTTCTINLKFSVSNLLTFSVKKIKILEILDFLNSTGHTHVANGCE